MEWNIFKSFGSTIFGSLFDCRQMAWVNFGLQNAYFPSRFREQRLYTPCRARNSYSGNPLRGRDDEPAPFP